MKNSIQGLSSREVEIRKEKGLVNNTKEEKIRSNWQIIKDYLFTLFNLFNLLIAIALLAVRAITNLLFILIIIINVLIGIIQEINAKKKVEKLKLLNHSNSIVVRDNVETSIDSKEIVVDDVLIISAGNQVPSDATIIEGEVEVNESLLTGESDNILKKPGDLLLSGSYLVSGKCYAKVIKVGKDSFVSQITSNVKKHKKMESELLNAMRFVTKFTTFLIIPIGITLFIQAYFFQDLILKDSIIATSGALLGMLPKGLLLLISITLALGVIKLAKKEVLIQELYSIETLAHIDVLCLDKTGTITEGKMVVTNLYKFSEDLPISIEDALAGFVQNIDDNNATFLAMKEKFSNNYQVEMTAKTPFSSERKWSSVTLKNIGSLVIGAPEKLINNNQFNLPDNIINLQKSGKRILLLGYTKEKVEKNILQELKIVAAIELDDPLRKNAKNILDFFSNEGVEVKIISGDNPLTVASIAREAGLKKSDSYIDLSKIENNEDIANIVDKYSVFARVSPLQKSLIVKALQSKGHKVAMTGDGVNDIIALRHADCSIAMASGSDASKQIAQIVLLNSDFGVLKDILMEGRRVVNNVTNIAKIFFIKTIYSVLLSFICIFMNVPFPFLPIQITLIDLAIEAYTSLFISFEPNGQKIKESFLKTVIKNALPYAITIALSIVAVSILENIITISSSDSLIIKYYLIGFITILAVIKSCLPFNKLRTFLCSTTIIGFYLATIIFKEILHLEIISKNALGIFLIFAIASVPVKIIIAKFINFIIKIGDHQKA